MKYEGEIQATLKNTPGIIEITQSVELQKGRVDINKIQSLIFERNKAVSPGLFFANEEADYIDLKYQQRVMGYAITRKDLRLCESIFNYGENQIKSLIYDIPESEG